MVSVEQIVKKNQLSKELKEHGFAVDFSEAFAQAERIYNKEMPSPEVEFADESRVEIQRQPETLEEIQRLQERIHSLERHKKFAEKREREREEQIEQLTSKINEMVKGINMIEMNQQSFHKQLLDVKISGSAPESSSQISQESDMRQVDTPDNSKRITTPIDRNGIAPADVSVEKIFYSGSN